MPESFQGRIRWARCHSLSQLILFAAWMMQGCQAKEIASDNPVGSGGTEFVGSGETDPTGTDSPSVDSTSSGSTTSSKTGSTKANGGAGGKGSGNTKTGGASNNSEPSTSFGGETTSTPNGSSTDSTPPGRVKLTPNKAMTTCETAGSAASTQRIEAECAFGASTGNCTGTSGGQQGTQLERSDTAVGYIEGGDYLYFDAVDMSGMRVLKVNYAKGVDGGKVEVRIDSTTGKLLGTLTPASTGAWETWSTATVELAEASGAHSLYILATGSTAGIVNLDWIELSPSNAQSAAGGQVAFHLNQVGFDALGPKHAIAEGAADQTTYSIVGNDGKVVWCGELKPQSFGAWGSSKSFYSIDFSELTRPGTYRLQIGSSASPKFEIGEDRLFSATFAKVLSYFNAVRADDADVWAADASVPLNGTDKRIDVRGGWYDASGDISKYLSHLSYANFLNPQQIPLVAWSLAWAYDEGGAALSGLGVAPKVQSEALWGADYLLRVLDPAGFFYMTVFDHWSGELGQREVCAFEGEAGNSTNSWQTALREGGGMAIAALARVARWQSKGAFSASEYLAGAERAFEHLQTNGQQYADDGKENVIDDYTGLLAASELYATTNTATYLDAARKRATSLIARLSGDGYFIADGASRPFWHASDAGLPTVALLRYLQVEADDTRKSTVQAAIRKHLDYQLRVTSAVVNPFGYARQHTSATSQGFFIPHENESKYWWQGENARLSSLAAAALLGAEALQTSGSDYLDLIRFAGYQLDWVLGANPYNLCFLQGFGTENPPKYCADKTQSGTIAGGIANGITGQAPDGSGIQWLSGGECWDDWRWVEQWLPHAAWYLVAITALAQQ